MAEAAPLVLLPGLSCSAEVWNAVRADLPGVDCRAPEFPPLEDVDAIAAALLEELPPRFALAGFSFGGYVALAIAAAVPRRIERIALISTGARADTPEGSANREKLIGLARGGRYAMIDASMTPFLLHPDHQADAEIAALRKRMSAQYGVERFIAHQRAAMRRPARVELLATLGMPALVAVGREDRITPPALAEEMAGRLPAARLVHFERCGHLSPAEAAQPLAAALHDWLDR